MAQETVWFDDLALQQGERVPVDSRLGRNMSFSFEGQNYEIDLADDNAEKLRAVLAPYVDAGRRAGTGAPVASSRRLHPRPGSSSAAPVTLRSVPPLGATPGKNANPETWAIREWCSKVGLQVNMRGRIPRGVEQAYNNRNKATDAPSPADRNNTSLVWITTVTEKRNASAPLPPPLPTPINNVVTEPEPDPDPVVDEIDDDEPTENAMSYDTAHPRHAVDKQEYRQAALTWARIKGIPIAPRGWGISPTLRRQFSDETGLLPPKEAVSA